MGTASFFDLGSGVGRLVMHMAIKGYARLATGIELNSARHALAVELADDGALPEDMPWVARAVETNSSGGGGEAPLTSGVQFLNGDMLEANISSATVIYMNPACLSCETRLALLQKIINECTALAFVLTTSPLIDFEASGHFVHQQTETLSPMIGYDWQMPVMLYRHVANTRADDNDGYVQPQTATALRRWVWEERANVQLTGQTSRHSETATKSLL